MLHSCAITSIHVRPRQFVFPQCNLYTANLKLHPRSLDPWSTVQLAENLYKRWNCTVRSWSFTKQTRMVQKGGREGKDAGGDEALCRQRRAQTMGRRCSTLRWNRVVTMEEKYTRDDEQMPPWCTPQKYPSPSCAISITGYKRSSVLVGEETTKHGQTFGWLFQS